MQTLIVDDDFTNRLILQEMLKNFGSYSVAVNGKEAVMAVEHALASGRHFDLICLDIMMPEMNGQLALQEIRRIEKEQQVKPRDAARILMTTALDDPRNIIDAFKGLCDGYLIKPIKKVKLLDELRKLGLVP